MNQQVNPLVLEWHPKNGVWVCYSICLFVRIVVRIECWFVGSYDPTSHNISIVLRLYSGSFLLCFHLFFLCFLCFFSWFLRFSSIFSVFFSLNSINNPCVYDLLPAYRSYLKTRTWLHSGPITWIPLCKWIKQI